MINQTQHKKTRRQAWEAGALTVLPDRLALPSRDHFEGVLSTVENPEGYIMPLVPFVLPDLHLENGRLYLQDMDATAANLIRLKDKTLEGAMKIDAPLLHALNIPDNRIRARGLFT